jgi:Ca2+/Na+ antiporter
MPYTLPAIVIRPEVSRYQRHILISLHLLVVIGLILVPLETLPRLILLAMLSLHALYIYRRYYAAKSGSVVELKLEADGEVMLKLGKGQTKQGRISDETLVTPWLIILRIEGPQRRFYKQSLLLWPDMLHADELRQLRVLLRFLRTDQ